jgi:hypothetical protein
MVADDSVEKEEIAGVAVDGLVLQRLTPHLHVPQVV